MDTVADPSRKKGPMSSQRPDRRVRRTKRRLKAALLESINERDYDTITIEDITEQADVGRSTFYSHFTSKDDLHNTMTFLLKTRPSAAWGVCVRTRTDCGLGEFRRAHFAQEPRS